MCLLPRPQPYAGAHNLVFSRGNGADVPSPWIPPPYPLNSNPRQFFFFHQWIT